MWFSSLLCCNTIFYIVWSDKWNCRPGPCMTSLNLLHGTGEKYCSRVKEKNAGWYMGMSWFLQFSLHVLSNQEIIKRARGYPQVKWESCLCHHWTDGIRALLGLSLSPFLPCISEAVSRICLFSQFLAIWNLKITQLPSSVCSWNPQDTTESFPSQPKGLKISFPFLHNFFFLMRWHSLCIITPGAGSHYKFQCSR